MHTSDRTALQRQLQGRLDSRSVTQKLVDRAELSAAPASAEDRAELAELRRRVAAASK